MAATLTEPSTPPRYRWDVDSFLRAQEAGVFDGRVELVDGEVWRVTHGDWHGRRLWVVGAALQDQGRVTSATLASGGSLPDPDLWVQRPGARPVGTVSPRLARWDPEDVLLVVEVSDESVQADLTIKAHLYGAAGYARYWVVTRDGLHEHTGPEDDGYARVRLLGPDAEVPLPDGGLLPVRRLLQDD